MTTLRDLIQQCWDDDSAASSVWSRPDGGNAELTGEKLSEKRFSAAVAAAAVGKAGGGGRTP